MTGRVLVVDDDQFVLLALKALQKRIGCKIEAASSSRQALEMLRSEGPFEVVVSDRDMPGMDGLEFLRRCRECQPSMIRLMLSGSLHDEHIEQALQEDLLLRFIPKPCLPHQLASHLDAALAEYHRFAASC